MTRPSNLEKANCAFLVLSERDDGEEECLACSAHSSEKFTFRKYITIKTISSNVSFKRESHGRNGLAAKVSEEEEQS